jgi:hypothetical protein
VGLRQSLEVVTLVAHADGTKGTGQTTTMALWQQMPA